MAAPYRSANAYRRSITYIGASTAIPTKLRIFNTNSPSDFREWIATPAARDTPAGSSVDITITQTSGGVAPPDVANTLKLTVYAEDATIVRIFTLTPDAASQTVTFFFTAIGTSVAQARAGTVELAIRATRTDVVAYDVESDGSPNTVGAGFSSTLERGWVRGTTTATTMLSNVSLGGAKNSPAAHPDNLYVRINLAVPLYVNRILTVTLSNTTPTLSGVTNSALSGNWDVTFSAAVTNRFPAAATTTVATLTIANAALTGLPDTVFTSVTSDVMDVDARVSLPHRFQIDYSLWNGTDVASGSRSGSELGFLAVTALNARGVGINLLSVTDKLWDTAALVGDEAAPVKTATITTRSILGVAGRTATTVGDRLPIAWDNQLPRGSWTAKATLNGATVTGLEHDNTRTLTLTADPDKLDAFGLAVSGVLSLK